MKKVEKQAPPAWFEQWKKDFYQKYGRQARYKGDFSTSDEDGGKRRLRLREELTREQGYICCYCMKRIVPGDAHIEHFLPKEQFRSLDMDYRNLFASCNGEAAFLLEDDHCGHRKENWWSQDMVSPSDEAVEEMFRYGFDGAIYCAGGQKTAAIARQMIRHLGLDSYHLQRSRREAIEGSEVFDEADYSQEDLRSFIEYYSHPDNGKYVPYCMAIVGCLAAML